MKEFNGNQIIEALEKCIANASSDGFEPKAAFSIIVSRNGNGRVRLSVEIIGSGYDVANAFTCVFSEDKDVLDVVKLAIMQVENGN